MTRRTLATTLLSISPIAAAGAEGGKFRSKRTVGSYTHTVGFPASKVFPLLCPVLEYDWIDGWQCEMVYTDSGVAENNCIFVTSFPDSGRQVWSVSRYEPDSRIEFVMMGADLVSRLDILLEESGGRDNPAVEAHVHWSNSGRQPDGGAS